MSTFTGLIIGLVMTLLAIAVVGYFAMKRIKNSEDFTVAGRKASPVMIAGTILGSCVGAGGTIGTAETAFKLGVVGWWQTLGLSIGCLILGLFLAQFLYKTRVETVPQVLIKTYGPKVGPITSIFSAIAIFLSILSQTKGFIPLLVSIIPMPIAYAAAISVVVILIYVLFGGIFGTSMGGILKMAMIYMTLIISAIVAYIELGGISGMTATFSYDPWFNMFARGPATDIAIGLGFALGVLVTQTYVQAVLSARDAKAARNGAILSAILTFPIGIFGVLVGLYMKTQYPSIIAAQALPKFLIIHFHPVFAGLCIGAMMLAAIGSNAGLTLGISTSLSRDIYKKLFRTKASDKEMMLVLRSIMIITCVLSAIFAVTKAGELIQTFIFLSFGMRTCVFLVPMMFAFYYKGRLTNEAGLAAVLAGPLVNIYMNLAKPISLDPIYGGLGASFIAFVLVNEIAKRMHPLEIETEPVGAQTEKQ